MLLVPLQLTPILQFRVCADRHTTGTGPFGIASEGMDMDHSGQRHTSALGGVAHAHPPEPIRTVHLRYTGQADESRGGHACWLRNMVRAQRGGRTAIGQPVQDGRGEVPDTLGGDDRNALLHQTL